MNEMLRLDQAKQPLRRRLAALAFLDVVGYSRLVAVSEEATLEAWSTLRHDVIEPRIVTWRGRIVDRAGDGIFAEFSSALEALHWAVDVQRAAASFPHVGDPIQLRIALHLADVIDGPDGEVQGDGVNTTARLQNHADAGGVIVSQAVVNAVQGKTDAAFIDLGLLNLKNLTYPVHAFRLGVAPRTVGRAWMPKRAAQCVIGTFALSLLLLASVWHQRIAPREQAERLLQQGLAIKCLSFPCGREWLDQRALFQQAIAADPTFARPYAETTLTYTNFVSSGLSSDTAEDLRTAASFATRAVGLAPGQAFAYAARGAVLRQNPETLEKALADYLRVLFIDPSQTLARANAGWLLFLLGRPVEAEPYLRAAFDADPTNPSAPAWLNRLGLVNLFLDRDGHGSDFFQLAIARQSEADAMANAGLERAINLAAALALDGKLNDARQVIDRLRGQYPSISTRNIWSCECSHVQRFKIGMAKLRQGAVLAGVLDTD